jgi:hypothetical protein
VARVRLRSPLYAARHRTGNSFDVGPLSMERVGSSIGRAEAETFPTEAKPLKLALMGLAPASCGTISVFGRIGVRTAVVVGRKFLPRVV